MVASFPSRLSLSREISILKERLEKLEVEAKKLANKHDIKDELELIKQLKARIDAFSFYLWLKDVEARLDIMGAEELERTRREILQKRRELAKRIEPFNPFFFGIVDGVVYEVVMKIDEKLEDDPMVDRDLKFVRGEFDDINRMADEIEHKIVEYEMAADYE